MFHFFGRMRGNGRKAAPDYRLLDYADHLRFIRPFVQARYGSEPAQEILSILKDSADDEWTYPRSRKALQPLTGRGDAEFLARVELMASEAIGGVAWPPIDPMVPECLSEESACAVVELFEMPE